MSEPNHLLKEARLERGWTQEEVARKMNTDKGTVSRWERGIQPTSLFHQKQLSDLFQKSPKELGFFPEAAEKQPTQPIWHVPYAQNPYFTDQQQRIQAVHERFSTQRKGVSHLAISGLGGIGKTQLALEYAYHYRSTYTAVLWINASTPTQLLRDLATLAKRMQVPEAKKGKPKQPALVEEVIQWFQTHDGWLLILDNVEEETLETHAIDHTGMEISIVRSLLALQEGHILLTTRSQTIARLAHNFPLDVMQPEEGATVLLLRSSQPRSSQIAHEEDTTDQEEALALARRLGGLPLALEQARAYIEATACSVAEYRQLYEASRKQLLAEVIKGSRLEQEYGESVATTWLISFERVKMQASAASDLLKLYAYFSPDAIPEDIILKGSEKFDANLHQFLGDRIEFNRICQILLNYSLIKRNAKEAIHSIHRLVQAVLQDRMDEQEQRFWAQQVVHAVEHAFTTSAPHVWQPNELYLQQAQACVNLIHQWNILTEEATQLMYQVGHNLRERGLHTEAEPLLRTVLQRYTRLHGTHHAEVIKSLNQLSLLSMEMGKDAQADDFYQQARIQQEQVLDPMSLQRLMPHVFDLVEQGKADQAIHVCQKMLMDEVWLQRQDPLLKTNIHYLLAGLYTYQGEKELADIHYQRALAMQTAMIETDHPLNGKLLMDMAHYYLYLGEIDQAKVYITQALEILLKTLGPDHLEVATAQEILADIFVKMGEHAKAEQLYQQVLEIRKQKKVSYDTDIIRSHHRLATLAAGQGADAQAEQRFQEALRLSKEALASQSGSIQDVVPILINYAHFLAEIDHQDEAAMHMILAQAIEAHANESKKDLL